MARVFKRTFRDKAGRLKQAKKWYVEFYDQKNDLKRPLPGYTDKKSSLDLGERLEKLSALAATRQEPDAELRRWLEALPARCRIGYCGMD